MSGTGKAVVLSCQSMGASQQWSNEPAATRTLGVDDVYLMAGSGLNLDFYTSKGLSFLTKFISSSSPQ